MLMNKRRTEVQPKRRYERLFARARERLPKVGVKFAAIISCSTADGRVSTIG